MKWLGIALVIYIFVNGFINEIRGRIGNYNSDNDYYDDYNDDYEEDYYNNEDDLWANSSPVKNNVDYSSPKFDTSFISHDKPHEYHHKDTYEYKMLVRVRGSRYARQEEIVVEAHNRAEAKQKAINMGYDIIRCNWERK